MEGVRLRGGQGDGWRRKGGRLAGRDIRRAAIIEAGPKALPTIRCCLLWDLQNLAPGRSAEKVLNLLAGDLVVCSI